MISSNSKIKLPCESSVTVSYSTCGWNEETFLRFGGYVAVVLNFNKAEQIRSAVDSSFNQDFPYYEILLLDDCSTDGSYEIMRERVKEYEGRVINGKDGRCIKVSLVRNGENRSTLKQWMLATMLSNGKWFGMFCGDDVSHVNRISVVDQSLKNHPDVVAVCTNADSNNGRIIDKDNVQIWRGTDEIPAFSLLPGCTAFWRREIVCYDFPQHNMDDVVLTWCVYIKYGGDNRERMMWCFNLSTIKYSIGTGISTALEQQALKRRNYISRMWNYAKADRIKGKMYGVHTFDIIEEFDKRYGHDEKVRRQLHCRRMQARMESANWFERLQIWVLYNFKQIKGMQSDLSRDVGNYINRTFFFYLGGRIGYVFCSLVGRVVSHYKRIYRERLAKSP